MVALIEYLLEKQESKERTKFKIVKNIISKMGKDNNFEIVDKDIINIAKLIFDFKIEKSNRIYENFIENLANFFLKVIYYYENEKFERFNYLLQEEKGINDSLKFWIKENKNLIFNVCEYHLKESEREQHEIIFSNEYFEITRIYKKRMNEWGIPRENNDGLEVRILSRGEVYYKNGILLKEGEYILSGPQFKLDRYKILTKDAVMIIVKLKTSFLDRVKVGKLKKLRHLRLVVDENNMRKFLDESIFKDSFDFFIDLVITLLKINGLIESDIFSVSLLLNEEEEIEKIFQIVEENIRLPESEIKERILKKTRHRAKKVDEIVYKMLKLTLKKLIIREKTRYIIEEYRNNRRVDFEELIEKYNYSNMKSLRYNLNKIYNISIKEINHKGREG